MPTFKYLTPEEFMKYGQGFVHIGDAPDGLALISYIMSPPRAEDLLRSAASVLRIRPGTEDYSATPLGRLAEGLRELIMDQFVQNVSDSRGRSVESVILPKPLPAMLGDTLFQRLFGEPVPKTVSAAAVDTRGVSAATVGFPSETPDEPAFHFQTGESLLAFPLDGSPPLIVYMVHDSHGWPQFSFRRTFLQETMCAFPDSHFVVEVSDPLHSEKNRIPVMERHRYVSMRQENPYACWTWSVPRRNIAQNISALAQSLHKLHFKGMIHGDLKPSNILAVSDSIQAIDSLGLSPGSRSPAISKGWAAPEQIMAKEVDFQTDQYPLGLMLLSLVRGVLYGEEANVIIPTGGTSVERHTLLRDPKVYIDPEASPLPKDKISAWQRLIQKCLRFSPSDRFHSMAELASELDRIMEDDSSFGSIEIPALFGRPSFGTNAGGETLPCWVID